MTDPIDPPHPARPGQGAGPALPARLAALSLRTYLLMALSAAVAVLALLPRKRTAADPPSTSAALASTPSALDHPMRPASARAAAAADRSAPDASFLPVRLPPGELSESEANREAVPVEGSYRRDIERPRPVQTFAAAGPGASASGGADEALPVRAAGGPLSRRRDDRKTLPEVFRMPPDRPGKEPAATRPAETGAGLASRPGSPGLEEEFAPYGRLVKCELVNTVDSATARPEAIVALVTEDLAWNGRIIVPAGTEAFSYARPEPSIDAQGVGRLVDVGEWTLVLPAQESRINGRELILKGRAVDRRETAVAAQGRVRSWSIDDGADGLIGYAISTLDREEIKLFAAAAVTGLAQGVETVVERQQPAPGLAGALGATQPAATAENLVSASLGQGAVGAMNELAGRIRQEIARRGVYVRVPAGKEFYLFVEQTIDPRAAAVGARRIAGAVTPRDAAGSAEPANRPIPALP